MRTASNQHTPKQKILIANASKLNREILVEILGTKYEYLFAEDGETLLQMLNENVEADILLLDLNLPKLSGMEVLNVMWKHRWTEDIPVVIISAEDDMNVIQHTYSLGAIDYIPRPFNSFLVQRRVENTLAIYTKNKHLVRLVEEQVFQREKINSMLIQIFSHVVSLGNRESGSHTRRVQAITHLLLNQLVKTTDKYPLTETEISMISSVSALHDIGKITIPSEILNKSGPLTSEEWEIMKSHTTRADEFLKRIPVDQNDDLMVLAHDICLHHHERWDGCGYPDGLAGDEIPISAQVVALADTYDALTSDRCYKDEFSHETAMAMISAGKCGSFNPILLQCLREIPHESLEDFKLNSDTLSYMGDAHVLAEEAMNKQELHIRNRSNYLVARERIQKEFFADQLGGIQFCYDVVAKKILYIYYYNKKSEKKKLSPRNALLLSDRDFSLLVEKLTTATRDHPIVTMNVLVPIKDELRWHKLTVRTIWPKGSSSYVEVIGHFQDIHQEIVSKAKPLIVQKNPVSFETFVSMRNIFDVVRLVDPVTHDVLKVQSDGGMAPCGVKCYETWNLSQPCQNCISAAALGHRKWVSKLETRNGQIYYVLSKCVTYAEKDYIMEIAFRLDDPTQDTPHTIGYWPDSITLQNFYKDTLTDAYSRAYFDCFSSNLENADGIAMIDVDDFKQINDTYGHQSGDTALKRISSVIRSCITDRDALIRYGGDEFLLAFQSISKNDFYKKLKTIKNRVSQTSLDDHTELKLRISIGGAYRATPLTHAIDIADKEMYHDKYQTKR